MTPEEQALQRLVDWYWQSEDASIDNVDLPASEWWKLVGVVASNARALIEWAEEMGRLPKPTTPTKYPSKGPVRKGR